MLKSMNKREEDARLLRSLGLRATPKRIALIHHLRKQNAPQRVEDLLRPLRSVLDQATLYRNLEDFERVGLVRRTQLAGQGASYEIAGHHHHHLVCTTCGTIEDVDACLPASFSKDLLEASKKFSSVADHSLEFFGTCRKCARL